MNKMEVFEEMHWKWHLGDMKEERFVYKYMGVASYSKQMAVDGSIVSWLCFLEMLLVNFRK